MEIKTTTNRNAKLKDCYFENGILFDKDGNELGLMELLLQGYDGKYFDITVTSKTEEVETINGRIDEGIDGNIDEDILD